MLLLTFSCLVNFGDFHARTTGSRLALRNSAAESGRELFKGSKDVASLLVCNWKKNFVWGWQIFCEWYHKWRAFGPPWPISPGPGPKSLDGSISL